MDRFTGAAWSAGIAIPTALAVRTPIITFKLPSANPKMEAAISELTSSTLTARISPPAIKMLILNPQNLS
jgi:hypothetical protein